MGTGQTLITIGALILISVVILNGNRILTDSEDVLNQTRFGIESIAIATSIIEEASQLPYDEVSWDSTKIEKKVSDFTITANLGTDYGENNYITFDDFDDFNNFTLAETTSQNIYNIKCKVNYVNAATPDVIQGPRTYFKKLTVFVTSPFNADTLKMAYVHGYWYFN